MADRQTPTNDSKGSACDEIDEAVGGTVRLLRRARGISLAALGRYLGLSYQQVQKYENGANRMGASVLFRIARFLEVDVGDLFTAVEMGDERWHGVKHVVMAIARESSGETIPEDDIAAAMFEYQRIDDADVRAAVVHLMKRLAGKPAGST